MNSPLPHTPSTLANIDRREFVARLLAATPDALVITGLGSPTYDVYASGDQDRYFYLWGAMGGALPLGLGLALAQPQRPVLRARVLELAEAGQHRSRAHPHRTRRTGRPRARTGSGRR